MHKFSTAPRGLEGQQLAATNFSFEKECVTRQPLPPDDVAKLEGKPLEGRQCP